MSVHPFPDLEQMSDDELETALAAAERQEAACSQHRRMVHERIDVHLKPALLERIKNDLAEGRDPTPAGPGRTLYNGTGADLDPDHLDLGPLPDVDSLSTAELRAMVRELEQRDDDVSLLRRFLQGKVDILRAERARRQRGEDSIGPDDLGQILGGRG